VSENKLRTNVTDKQGRFWFLNVKKESVQKIEITHLSFDKESYSIINDSIFYLNEKTNKLSEVSIAFKKEKVIYDLPFVDKLTVHSRNFGWDMKMAVFIPQEKTTKDRVIKKILYEVSDFGGVKGLKYQPFMANLYTIDTITKLPDKSLIKDGILVSKKDDKKWVEVDVSDYNFTIPREGIFIVFEILSQDKYKVDFIQSNIGAISAVPAIKAYKYNKEYIRKSYMNVKVWTIPIDRSNIWVEEECHYLMDLKF